MRKSNEYMYCYFFNLDVVYLLNDFLYFSLQICILIKKFIETLILYFVTFVKSPLNIFLLNIIFLYF